MQLQHDPRTSLACGGERARSEQRQHVVEVDDIGAQLSRSRGHVLLDAPAAKERARRTAASDLGGAALEQRVDDPGAAQRGELQLHRALLAALQAVAVMDDEHAHRRDYAIRRSAADMFPRMPDLPNVLQRARASVIARRPRRDVRSHKRLHRRFATDLVRHTDNFGNVTWLGHPIWQNVLDLWSLQEAIAELRPALLIESGTNRGGSALFYAHLFDLLGHGRVVSVDVGRMHSLEHERIEFLIGSSVDAQILGVMRERARDTDGPVMVVLDSDHARSHVLAELRSYAPLVTPGSLMLVQDGVIDTLPMFCTARPGPLRAIDAFLAEDSRFEVDPRFDKRFLITHHPSGWLRRRSP